MLNRYNFLEKKKLEVQRTQQSGRMSKDTRYADVYRERPIKVTVKVAVPIREHPKVITEFSAQTFYQNILL